MPTATSLDFTNVCELLHEHLDAMLAECNRVMDNAENGQILNNLETFLLDAGRKFSNKILQHKLQERVHHAEQTEESKQCPHCKKKTQYQNKKPKTLTIALGPIDLERLSRRCHHCRCRSFHADVTLGITDTYNNGLKRIVARCCGLWSYRLAADTLQELCGIHLTHTTLGKIAGHIAEEITARLQNHSDVRHAFQKAKGAVEFYADGVFVPILSADGTIEWREMKIEAYAKRERGVSALPREWSRRLLPKPTVVSAFTSVVDKEGFQELCQTMRRTLGVGGVSSALGDGALCP